MYNILNKTFIREVLVLISTRSYGELYGLNSTGDTHMYSQNIKHLFEPLFHFWTVLLLSLFAQPNRAFLSSSRLINF